MRKGEEKRSEEARVRCSVEEANGRPTLSDSCGRLKLTEDCGRQPLTGDCGRPTVTGDRGCLDAFARSKCEAEGKTQLSLGTSLWSKDLFVMSKDWFVLTKDLFVMSKNLFVLPRDLGVHQRSSKDRSPFSRDLQFSPDEEDEENVQALWSLLLSLLLLSLLL